MVLLVSGDVLSACFSLWLKDYMKTNNLTQLQASTRINVSQASVQHILSGRRKASGDLIRLAMGEIGLDYNTALAPYLNYPEIRKIIEEEIRNKPEPRSYTEEEWEEMNREHDREVAKILREEQEFEQNVERRRKAIGFATYDDIEPNASAPIPLVKVPLFDAGAGEPCEFRLDSRAYDLNDDDDFIYVSEAEAQMGAFGVKVNGNSMAPTIERGDVVIVAPTRAIDNGQIVLACWPGSEADPGKRLVKRYKSDGKNSVVLYSDNATHEPIILNRKTDRNVHLLRVIKLIKDL